MLFPTIDTQLSKVVTGIILGLLATIAIIILLSLAQVDRLSAMASTATATKTPTKPATATFIPSPTNTATPTPTTTPTPTSSATPTATFTPIPTDTSTATSTFTPPPPTFTPTVQIVDTAVITLTNVITPADVITPTDVVALPPPQNLTTTTGITGTGSITIPATITPTVGPPPPTPTSVPRSVLVPADIPDAAVAKDHLLFNRPFTEEFFTWGSYYYPFGTNARGQYFWHHGIDIQNPQNTPVIAVGDGTVVQAGPDTGSTQLGPWPDFYGQAIVIEHTQRWNNQPVYSLYGHVSQTLVQVGQSIKTGDTIGLVGQLGVALGPHLHLEIRLGSPSAYTSARNPDLWVRPDPGFGVIAGRVVDHQNYYVPQQLVTLHRAADGNRFWRQTFTYPDNVVNSDEEWGETFTFSDVPAGLYVVKTFFDGRQLSIPLTVTNQATTFVLLKQDQPAPRVMQDSPVPTAAPPTQTPSTPPPAEGQ